MLRAGDVFVLCEVRSARHRSLPASIETVTDLKRGHALVCARSPKISIFLRRRPAAD